MKILIVDDSRAMQTIVRRAVEKVEFSDLEFRSASNGIEALDIIRVWEPTLVLSDWHMPEMNGLELLQEINRQMLGVEVGFITTETSQEKQKQAFAAGASFFVQKPFEIETINKNVAPILQAAIDEEIKKTETEIESDEKIIEQQRPSTEDLSITLPGHDSLINNLSSLLHPKTTLTKSDKLILEDKHFPCMVGLFEDSQSNKLRAIGIIDRVATSIFGLTNQNTSTIKPINLKENTVISKDVFNKCHQIMQNICETLDNQKNTNTLKLSKLNILKKNSETIERLMAKPNGQRIDIDVNMTGTVNGKLTLITS